MRIVQGLLTAVLVLGLSVGVGWAAAPAVPPGKNKLPAPANVECPVVGTNVEVSWDAVVDANAYQVEYVGVTSAGAVVVESDFVADTADVIALDDFVSLTVHVRALPAPKKAAHPVQGVGPKGIFSLPCDVVIP